MGTGASKTTVEVIKIRAETEKYLDADFGWTEGPLESLENQTAVLKSQESPQPQNCVTQPSERDEEIQKLRDELRKVEDRARLAESQVLINRDASIGDQIAVLERELSLLKGGDMDAAGKTRDEVIRKLESDLRTAAEEMAAMVCLALHAQASQAHCQHYVR
eukprot:m.89094 g.89094  ORF g.89094 m.89094 type:complete len:162 (+) comp36599_c0_seq1:69-554(+)